MATFKHEFYFTLVLLFVWHYDLVDSQKILKKRYRDLKRHINWPLLDSGSACGHWKSRHDQRIHRKPRAERRILGGEDATFDDFPWLVRPEIIYLLPTLPDGRSPVKKQQCGGSLINNRYVLTAAHCCDNTSVPAILTLYKVAIRGDKADSPLKLLDVENVLIHENYTVIHNNLENDICLVRLKDPIEFSETIQPICLPTNRKWLSKKLTGMKGTVAGWGATIEDKETLVPTQADRLQKVDVYIIQTPHCIKEWMSKTPMVQPDPQRQFCAGNRVKDACVGDSGGPIMYKSLKNFRGPPRYFLLGLVSFGEHCTQNKTSRPSVFVKVAQYMPWILNNIYE